ncbi:hypothetical protein [Actinokineospora iranica]|uniref:Uncharacterized protein n=1 Tax=Actinokineospora iranica TaxID=1271860 RepID=A0A1G6PEL2_9PSEU|nr:hypothetical protein [Actinokineospora iranica]SDC78468.1 hypothetical protein SAMN05216174_104258 [Actinokineospora iranica]
MADMIAVCGMLVTFLTQGAFIWRGLARDRLAQERVRLTALRALTKAAPGGLVRYERRGTVVVVDQRRPR